MLTLFHAPHSRSSRIVWLLEELGAAYDIRYVSIRYGDGSGDGPDPANLHPDKKVPALLHHDTLVSESTAVAMRLCELFSEAGLAPSLEAAERGAYLTWMCWVETEFGPAVYARRAGQADARMQANYQAALRRVLEALGRGPYLMGENFTVVDVMAGAVVLFAREHLPESDLIDAYAARLAGRPALGRAWAKDAPTPRAAA